MVKKDKNIYENLNLISFVAMAMIFVIHFMNNFHAYGFFGNFTILTSFLRAISVIAVPLYIAVSSYTYITLEKRVDLHKLIMYIVIPTILFVQVNHVLFGYSSFTFDLKEGMSGSWFGDMFIVALLLVPVCILRFKNYKIFMPLMHIFVFIAFLLSIKMHSATLLGLGFYVGIAYLPLFFVLEYWCFKIKFYNRTFYIIALVFSLLFLTIGYLDNLNEFISIDKRFFISYFSPFNLLATVSVVKIVLNENLKIKNIRTISQSSYFFYFTHYIFLNTYKFYLPNRIEQNTFILFVLGMIGAYVLSFTTYYIYSKIVKFMAL